jgi:D-aminoacyl-tRNA deacylase
MRALLQRVIGASVTIDRGEVRRIGPGLVVFLGVKQDDRTSDVDYLVDKIVGLRVFRDESGKMNLSVSDIRGECLIVSQFTLYGDARKGRRPSFVTAAPPSIALPLYERFIDRLRNSENLVVQSGEFGADMVVEIKNDGPVTLMIES